MFPFREWGFDSPLGHHSSRLLALMESEPVKPPSLRELMIANLKVIGVVALVMVAAWLVWQGLARLFPETDWLQL